VGATWRRLKAAVYDRYGPPELVRIAEVAKPAVNDHEVPVKVHATTVNRTDCGFRGARPFFTRFFTGLRRPRVKVQGGEFAGRWRRSAVGSRPSRSATGCSASPGSGSAPTPST